MKGTDTVKKHGELPAGNPARDIGCLASKRIKDPVRCGVAGLGRIGWCHHSKIILAHNGFELAAVCDLEDERIKEAQDTWGVHLVDQSLQLMGSKPKFVWGKVSHLLNPGDAEDDIQAIIEGENGVVAAIDMTCVDAAKRPFWIINGRWGTFWIADGKAHVKYISPKRMRRIDPIDMHLALNRKYGVQPGPDTMTWKEETMDVKPTKTCDSFYDNLYNAVRRGAGLLVTPESARETYDVLSRIKRGSGF